MLIWNKVMGTQDTMPEPVDLVSSEYYIYIRRNIKRVRDDDGSEHWEYEEAKYPLEEMVKAIAVYMPNLATGVELSERIDDLENAMMDIYELADSIASAQEGING